MSLEPSKRRHMGGTEGESLNLIPIMNLLTILIPFLTLSAVFVKLTILPTTLPATGPTKAQQEEQEEKEEEEEKLNLTINIAKNGFTIAGTGGVLGGEGGDGPTIPKKDNGEYDFEALTEKLIDIKRKYPEEKDVILIPEMKMPGSKEKEKVDIAYQTIIDTMDAIRSAPEPVVDSNGDGRVDKVLFPGVIFSPGIL